MDTDWAFATRQLVRCLMELDQDQVLAIEPPHGWHWSQILRQDREFLAEVQSNVYLEGSGCEWTPDQEGTLRVLGWSPPDLAADEPGPGSPNHHAAYGLEEAVDLARSIIGVYQHVVLSPVDQLWASFGGVTRDLLAGSSGINELQRKGTA